VLRQVAVIGGGGGLQSLHLTVCSTAEGG
jgi:hypothetical protein